jgi:hypothetical protein
MLLLFLFCIGASIGVIFSLLEGAKTVNHWGLSIFTGIFGSLVFGLVVGDHLSAGNEITWGKAVLGICGADVCIFIGMLWAAFRSSGLKQKVPTGDPLAHLILGDDFITPEAVSMARFGITYTIEQLELFEDTLPDREELEWLRDNGFMLVPGPNREMSLLEVRALNTAYFYTKSEGWYAADNEKFSHEDKVAVRWLKIRKGVVPGSAYMNWQEQEALLSAVEYVPNAAEATWAMTTYKAVRGIHLLPNLGGRTSSRDSYGDPVVVGPFPAGGLFVLDHSIGDRGPILGVASARK